MRSKQQRRWRRYLAEERLEADTYRTLARERIGEEREILLRLSQAEERHEAHWLKLLGPEALPAPRASISSRVLNYLARTFGSVFVLATMQRSEDRTRYDHDATVPPAMAADEHIHSEVVRGLAQRQRTAMSGMFRAAVFGANDGLVSTCALILGVMGTGTSKSMIVAAGVAGLLAGALSMGAGEYISVHSQRELLAASDPAPGTEDVVAKLDMDANELALVYRARGLSCEDAESKAAELFAQIEAGRQVSLAEEQATFDEVGTGMKAAISSFCSFAAGAAIPVIPYLLPLSVRVATIVAIVLVGVALMATGSIVGLLSGTSPATRALRQVGIGYAAAAITYLLGRLLGA
ncbi:MAG: VIT1/CCC1 family protein [Actinomycetaceae bacterium]|nr:VIT1/CCC1 family protein [Actinomycetaceae bacterium]MDU0970757.1 VIT1/CCC1 family protein [Actinomycetaceae bacterium]